MSNIKNKQHYVFQKYLEHWCNKDKKLWCYKKSENRIFPSSTKDVLCERQMYKIQEMNKDEREFFELLRTVFHLNDTDKSEMRNHIETYLQPYTNQKIVEALKTFCSNYNNLHMNEDIQRNLNNLDELIREQKINTEEDFYGSYEGDGNRWMEKLLAVDVDFYYTNSIRKLESELEVKNYEKYDFLNFITIQYFRTSIMRKRIRENIQKMIILTENCEKNIENRELINFNCRNINPEHILPHFIWIIQTKCAVNLINADIQIVRNKTKLPFITSDQPIINMKAVIGKDEAPAEFVLWYPLNPSVGIIINGDRGEKILEKRNEVDDYNRMIWNNAYEYVISNEEILLKGMTDFNW